MTNTTRVPGDPAAHPDPAVTEAERALSLEDLNGDVPMTEHRLAPA
jgi:hypothetical protein